jgi:hypothetical protein
MADKKPMSARTIRLRGALLDRAERERDEMLRNIEARGPYWTEGLTEDEIAAELARDEATRSRFKLAYESYGAAIYANVRFLKSKMENSKRVPRSSDRIPLWLAEVVAENRLDLINDTLWLCSTHREFVDAHAAYMLAGHAHVVAKLKFEEAAQFERRTGISKRPRSRVRLVTDGYVTTGKYKTIDGQCVPVLEKVS